jgi:hypothetical protein
MMQGRKLDTVPIIRVTWGEFARLMPRYPGGGGPPRRHDLVDAFGVFLTEEERNIAATWQGLRIVPQQTPAICARFGWEPRAANR